MKAIIGRKIGMTQIFAQDGTAIPVTVVEAGPCVVTQVKTVEKDGYNAVQVGFGEVKAKNLNKAQLGLFKKANVENKRVLMELDPNGETFEVGNEIKCDVFAEGDIVDVAGVSKGHGFSGVIKRWNAHGLDASHGIGPVHRSPGSLAANSDPSRVFKNRKLPGQYGNEKVTIQNLEIAKVDVDRNLLFIKGAIPGAKGAVVTICSAVKA